MVSLKIDLIKVSLLGIPQKSKHTNDIIKDSKKYFKVQMQKLTKEEIHQLSTKKIFLCMRGYLKNMRNKTSKKANN